MSYIALKIHLSTEGENFLMFSQSLSARGMNSSIKTCAPPLAVFVFFYLSTTNFAVIASINGFSMVWSISSFRSRFSPFEPAHGLFPCGKLCFAAFLNKQHLSQHQPNEELRMKNGGTRAALAFFVKKPVADRPFLILKSPFLIHCCEAALVAFYKSVARSCFRARMFLPKKWFRLCLVGKH